MPLLQKPNPPPARADAGQTAPGHYYAGSTPAYTVWSRSLTPAQRRREARYDRLVRLGATVVGLLGCAVGWVIGSYFTLRWLQSLGVGLADTGLVPIHTLLQIGPSEQRLSWDSIKDTWPTMAGAWAIPLSITLAEIGFDPQRAGGRTSRLLWGIFLSVDAVTTGLGVQPLAGRFASDSAVSWVLAGVVGLLLALIPEKVARRLILENLS